MTDRPPTPAPEIAALLAAGADVAPLNSLTVDEARTRMRQDAAVWWGAVDDEVMTEDFALPNGCTVRRYGEPAANGAAVLHFHGGGWVIGDLATHAGACAALATATGIPVYSVDYRLAPEHPFPAAALDAQAAIDWLATAGADLGVDIARVVVTGDSAGGNLAAIAAIHAASTGRHIAAQVLIYPVTSAAMDTGSYRDFADGYGLTAAAMQWFFRHYAGNDVAAVANDPRLSPLAAAGLEGVAPALVVTAELDPLRDEGRAYAARLTAAGVGTRLREWPGMIHGFSLMRAFTPANTELWAEIAAFVEAHTR